MEARPSYLTSDFLSDSLIESPLNAPPGDGGGLSQAAIGRSSATSYPAPYMDIRLSGWQA